MPAILNKVSCHVSIFCSALFCPVQDRSTLHRSSFFLRHRLPNKP
jgi:hypothetical protein